MKLAAFLINLTAVSAIVSSNTQARASEISPPATVTSIPQGVQINNRQTVDRIDRIELGRLAIDQANTKMKGYAFKQRLMKTLGSELADALEKSQYFRARLIAMQLAPKFGFKDYKLFLTEVTSGKFPTAAIGNDEIKTQPALLTSTTVNPQTSYLWDAPIDQLQTQQIASSKQGTNLL